MAKHVAKIFENVPVEVDGEEFLDCEFRRAELVYSGGPVPVFTGCTFDSVNFMFQGAAGRTTAFIAFLHSVPGIGRLV